MARYSFERLFVHRDRQTELTEVRAGKRDTKTRLAGKAPTYICLFSQFHLDPKFNEIIAAQTLAKSRSPFRGIAIFEATSLDKIFEIFQDEEYLRVVVPDEHKFFDHENAQILAGPFATIIDL